MPKPRKNSGSESPFNPAALRALMERMLGGLGPSKRNDEQRAQDLVYDAMEAPTWEQRLRKVRQALELDPENVDALLMLAEAAELKSEERIARCGTSWPPGRSGAVVDSAHGSIMDFSRDASATRRPRGSHPRAGLISLRRLKSLRTAVRPPTI